MALQPAAGTRDLNPREVVGNRWLSEQLGQVYRLWGYVEVSPPSVERLQTLEAGGRINDSVVGQFVVIPDRDPGVRRVGNE